MSQTRRAVPTARSLPRCSTHRLHSSCHRPRRRVLSAKQAARVGHPCPCDARTSQTPSVGRLRSTYRITLAARRSNHRATGQRGQSIALLATPTSASSASQSMLAGEAVLPVRSAGPSRRQSLLARRPARSRRDVTLTYGFSFIPYDVLPSHPCECLPRTILGPRPYRSDIGSGGRRCGWLWRVHISLIRGWIPEFQMRSGSNHQAVFRESVLAYAPFRNKHSALPIHLHLVRIAKKLVVFFQFLQTRSQGCGSSLCLLLKHSLTPEPQRPIGPLDQVKRLPVKIRIQRPANLHWNQKPVLLVNRQFVIARKELHSWFPLTVNDEGYIIHFFPFRNIFFPLNGISLKSIT